MIVIDCAWCGFIDHKIAVNLHVPFWFYDVIAGFTFLMHIISVKLNEFDWVLYVWVINSICGRNKAVRKHLMAGSIKIIQTSKVDY